MKNRKLILLAAALVLLLLIAIPAYRALAPTVEPGAIPMEPPAAAESPAEPAETPPAEESAVPDAELAPDFTVYDTAGNALRLSDLRGKPVVINFWATWCPPCREELPHFDAACAELGGEIVFMMIDLTDGGSETVEGVLAFLEETGYRFPVYYDKDMDAASAYEISAIPLTVLVDAQGRLVDRHLGSMTAAQLESLLDKLR